MPSIIAAFREKKQVTACRVMVAFKMAWASSIKEVELRRRRREKEDKEMKTKVEYHDIVIVGGGICGLATALALHRKGITSLVLERSDKLRATGGAISIYLNGWHALDQLGVGEELRTKCIHITELHDVRPYDDEMQVTPIREEGLRCVKRSDLIETMAASLPPDTIRLGCQIVAVEIDPVTFFPTVYIEDGSMMKTKILIGCDGSNSVVAKALGLKSPKLFPTREVRGFTNYPDGHNFGSHFLRMRGNSVFLGRMPVDDKLVFWFVDQEFHPIDLETRKDSKLTRDRTVESLKNHPKELIEMVNDCDLSSLTLTRIRYRAPWHLAFGNFCKGTVTVAGDAMHQMDPSIGQGGCIGLEDAVVLARCLAQELPVGRAEGKVGNKELQKRAGVALRRFVRERRWRVLILSTKSYLIGSLFGASWFKRIVFLIVFTAFFGGRFSHTQYDCGHL